MTPEEKKEFIKNLIHDLGVNEVRKMFMTSDEEYERQMAIMNDQIFG